jgi:hypothetical protein
MSLQGGSNLQLQGSIIDMRDNPGGSVIEGLEIAGKLVPPDSLFMTALGRAGQVEDIRVPQSGNDDVAVKGGELPGPMVRCSTISGAFSTALLYTLRHVELPVPCKVELHRMSILWIN